MLTALLQAFFVSELITLSAFSKAIFANKGYENNPTFFLFVYIALTIFFYFDKFLWISSLQE